MRSYPEPFNEKSRLLELRRTVNRTADDDPLLNETVSLVRKLFDCPTALVSLVEEDEQWFKARDGFNLSRTPRDYSLCAHTIMSDESLVICDTLSDPKFSNHPVVINDPNIRFYVGSPIILSSGYRIGSLCGIDYVARERPSDEKLILLNRLAKKTASHLERLGNIEREVELDHGALDLDARQEFISLIGHELRTPLTVLLGNSALLEAKITDATQKTMIEAIVRSGKHLQGLIERVISFSSLHKGDLSLTEELSTLCEIIDPVVESLRPIAISLDKTITENLSSDVDEILLDKEQIRLALSCILANACVHGGQNVRVSAVNDSDGNVLITVSDDGPGISITQLEKASSPFFVGEDVSTRKVGGMGLGLPLAKKIIELHGGEISVSDSDGWSTSVSLALPSWRGKVIYKIKT